VIAVLFLLADFLFQRPPGLWTALVLILTEILRGRSRSIRSLPFWLEWVTVAIGITVISSIYRLTLLMVLVPQGPLGLTILQLGLTLVTYPVVVFVSYALFGVNRPAPGEVDALGHRI
jgi:rod shape-determining protein MreD